MRADSTATARIDALLDEIEDLRRCLRAAGDRDATEGVRDRLMLGSKFLVDARDELARLRGNEDRR